MWLYCLILKIPWTAHVSNAEVLNSMGKEVELLMYAIKRRKLQYELNFFGIVNLTTRHQTARDLTRTLPPDTKYLTIRNRQVVKHFW